MEDYIEHFGVKGMKWGVRKEKPHVSNNSPSHRTDLSVKGHPSYKIDSEGRLTIEKGYTLQRMFQEGSSNGGFGSNYFAFTDKDKASYEAMMGAGAFSKFKFIRGLASTKVSQLTASKDLKSPSKEEAANILADTVKSMKKNKVVSSPPKDERKLLDWYTDANTAVFVDKDKSVASEFSKRLTQKGYDILIDEMDSGSVSDLPIILLDPKSSCNSLKISDLSKPQLENAKNYIKAHNDVNGIDYYKNKTLDHSLY